MQKSGNIGTEEHRYRGIGTGEHSADPHLGRTSRVSFVRRTVAMRPRFEKLNVNKCDIFYGIVLIQVACSSFPCRPTLSLY